MREDYDKLKWMIGDLQRTKKAIVILGCSFGKGKGAISQELIKECRPRRREHWGDCDYQGHDFDPETLQYYAEKYDLDIHDGMLMTQKMEMENSFGNRMCMHYLGAEYTPIILAENGKGNWSNIDRLNWLPIPWHKLEDIKVVWSITDSVRTDMFKGVISEDHGDQVFPERSEQHYHTIWPFDVEQVEDNFAKSYNRFLREAEDDPALTNWFATNFVKNMSNLNNWCLAHDADLVMFDAFTDSFDAKSLSMGYAPQMENSELLQNFIHDLPWEKKIKLNGEKTFFAMAMAQETSYDYMLKDKFNMWEFVELDEDDITCEWVMPCGHPSDQAHDMLAQILMKRLFK